jgi:hypothetical protein
MRNGRKLPALAGLVMLLVGTSGTVWAVEDICRTCHGNSVANIHHVGAMTCIACHSPGVVIRDCTASGCHDSFNLSNVCLSVEEESIAVAIDDAYTMNAHQVDQTEFEVSDSVMYHIDYTIFGDPGTRYKVIISIKSMGDKLTEVVRRRPGSYSTKMTNLADGGDVKRHTVTYTVKLRKGRTLLDVDTDTSQITVNP